MPTKSGGELILPKLMVRIKVFKKTLSGLMSRFLLSIPVDPVGYGTAHSCQAALGCDFGQASQGL